MFRCAAHSTTQSEPYFFLTAPLKISSITLPIFPESLLLELVAQGRQEAVNAIILMLEDFCVQGLESRFCKRLQGLPIWELKTRSRGGLKGGARLYFFFLENSQAVLVNAEYKSGITASTSKLDEVAQIILAYYEGIKVLEGTSDEQKN